MTERTPTDDEMRDESVAYISTVEYDPNPEPMDEGEARARFDRWLTDHDAKVRAEARSAALYEASDAFEATEIRVEVFGEGPDAAYWRGVNGARKNLVAALRVRAGRIERGEQS